MSYKVTVRHRNKMIYNFICLCGNEFTERVYHNDDVYCPKCNKLSSKKVGAPHLSSRMGLDSNSAQGRRWAKMHADEAKRQNSQVDPNPSS